jgi:hypothetical protein
MNVAKEYMIGMNGLHGDLYGYIELTNKKKNSLKPEKLFGAKPLCENTQAMAVEFMPQARMQ